MSSNASSMPPSKGASIPTQLPSPSQSQAPSTLPSIDRQRRSGSSFGAAASSRALIASPRNNQSSRKQNKASKRPKLGYDDMSEAAAMRSSRKGQTSITHLMNFTLPPRPQNYSHFNYHHGYRSSGGRRQYNWGYNVADKARFIHANYRFIVNPKGDYHNLKSVDDYLEWKDVLQVLASSQSQDASCPICLSTPVAPRMAKCGHIFCLPCLIRYMHSTDDSTPIPEKKARWKKCPICWDSIFVSEVRPVRWFLGQEGEPPHEGKDVVLRLMKREVDSNLALPRESAESTIAKEEIPWYFNAEVMDYARVIKGSEDYMRAQYDHEIVSLEAQEKEDELMFGEETQWTRRAIASISDFKERIKGLGNPPSKQPGKSEEKRPIREPITFTDEKDLPEFYRVAQANKSAQSLSHSSTANTAHSSTTFEKHAHKEADGALGPRITDNQTNGKAVFKSTRSSTNHDFFFYQALLHYYLAPLDIRILKTAFGDYSSFPSALLPQVERVSTGHIVDDDLRRRAKYLAHLPQGCEVGFLECDWTDIVPADILQNFSVELERRRKRNQDKEMREEKERLRAEKLEDDKKWAAIRRRRPSNAPSSADQPDIPGSSTTRGGSHPVDIAVAASPPWSRKRTGFASLASPSTSPNASRTVWGTTAVAPIESPSIQPLLPPEPQQVDGWLQGWETEILREEELVAQIQNASLGNTQPTPSSGKKKKNKKITLMTTNGRRAA